MSQREDRVRLQHMALTRLVEIIGEAAKNVSDDERHRHAAIPWRAIAGTRDRLTHAYFDVDLDQLWQIVASDLPNLVPVLERALAS
jgi:uncharacterized protein with HEPN domain